MVVDAVHDDILVERRIVAEHPGQQNPARSVERELMCAREDEPVEFSGPLAVQEGARLQPRGEVLPLLPGIEGRELLWTLEQSEPFVLSIKNEINKMVHK